MTTLDAWIGSSESPRLDQTWLKIDTQGSESEVLNGPRRALDHVAAVEIELPLRHWYESSADLCTLMSMMLDHGLVPATIMTERFGREWN